MIIIKRPLSLQDLLDNKRSGQKKIGFVPTMGALHRGHISLVEAAKKQNDIVACSIFVNPTQFNDPEDLKKYPVTTEADILMFEAAGCDLLFIPSVNDIYPEGMSGFKQYDLGYLEMVLEGKYRPGHFQGVCQVVHRLLEIVMPDNLYLGQKDYQQCMVIKKLVGLIGLAERIKVRICPTVREIDGLAMSSRNTRLSADEWQKATTISASLRYIKENIREKGLPESIEHAKRMLIQNGFKIDYLEAADAGSLQITKNWDGRQKIVVLAAAFLGNIRLIDNLEINP